MTNASGTCAVTATKAADTNYNATTSATALVALNKASQIITFGPLANAKRSQSPIIVSATASSGLTVTFTTTTAAVCTAGGMNGATITLLAGGTCTVVAHQVSNNNYLAAVDVPQSFTVGSGKTDQAITFATITAKTLIQSQSQ